MALTNEKKIELKKIGILSQKQEGYYVIRFLSKCGYFLADEMIAISNIATRYGNGEVSLTSRLTIEIPYIEEKDLDEVISVINKSNLRIGGTGNTVRAVVSCKGNVCVHGLIDTKILSEKIESEFFAKELPGKFKIGVFGCVNSYGKAQSNDLSIMPIKSLNKEEVEFLIFLGGRLGRKTRLATPMKRKFKENELMEVVEAVIEYYGENANTKERFAEVIDRIGIDTAQNSITSKLKC